jgi:GPH family glycoside/pentoside/hexuronide:cation symporter
LTTANSAASSRLSWSAIFDYVAPTIGCGFMFLLIAIYLMKFSTDVLAVSPAVVGTIFFIGRIWDAVTDPLAGFLSDRTRTRFGRRRPWFLVSILPLTLAFTLIWAAPASLSPTMTAIWLTVMVLGFYTGTTILLVPHTALGAELTDNYHDRTRIFGGRHLGWTLGSVLAVGGLAILDTATDARSTALMLALGASVITAGLILWTSLRVRERPEFQGRGAANPYGAFRDIWRNPHARVLLIVYAIESLGGATIGILTPYVGQYIVGRPDLTALAIFAYMIASVVFVPVWLPLSRRLGKKRLWLGSMILTAFAFGGMFFLQKDSIVLLNVLAMLAGAAASCGSMMGPSIQADVIDFDEHATRERKEGSYFAAWNFVFKCATGLTQMLTGYVLTFSGYVPNTEQSDGTKLAILALYGLFPFTCYLIGAALFAGFKLDEAGYAKIRTELDARR